MATSSRHRAPVRSACNPRANRPAKQRRYQRHELAAAAGGAALAVVIAVLSLWAHHSLSAVRPAPPHPAVSLPAGASTPQPSSLPMPAWLDGTEPSIAALLAARDTIVAAAARGDLIDTGTACRWAGPAVADAEQHLPSPDPALTTALQQALANYQAGIRYCILGTQNHDAAGIEQATAYISHGNSDLQAAFDILDRDLSVNARDTRVLMA